jgi:hypothetical protein
MKHVAETLVAFVMLLGSVALTADNQLSPAEVDAGWRRLFDGETTAGWRGYKQETIPPGWQVVDGALARIAGGAGGKGAGGGDDIITTEQFANFEFQVDWRILEPKGNSGLIVRASEEAVTSWHTAPEMQILDNPGYPGRDVRQLAGACYDLYAPAKDLTKPRGEWNTARIVANGTHMEHWLNGEKLLEYELGSDDWKSRVAQSKFKAMPGFLNPATKGHIVLQDHSARSEFKNIKLRPLP